MKKILVLTDLSANSKAGIIFAIQFAQQSKSTLVFYHVVELLKPTRWRNEKYQKYVKTELEKSAKKLEQYVKNGISRVKDPIPAYQCVVINGHNVVNSVIAYSVKIKAKAICLGTRGAGTFKKIIGTTASRILTKAKIPVFVIPRNYERTPLKEILYATDLYNYEAEIQRVEKLADLTNARITAYHYDYFPNLVKKLKQVKSIAKKLSRTRHKLRIRELQPKLSFTKHLLKDMKESKSSLVVLFTDPNKTWFKKIFVPSNSVAVSFSTKIPLLILEK